MIQEHCQSFPFPLNIYAWALYLERGRVPYLHFGLFRKPDEDIETALEHSTSLLEKNLPSPPARILEAGIGLGTTLKRLRTAGYEVYGITPDQNQAEAAAHYCGGKKGIETVSFEDLQPDIGKFDAVIFQESSQYLDSLDLFNGCLDLLKSRGRVLIMDEFCRNPETDSLRRLHYLDEFKALGRRCGFNLLHQEDLSSLAAPTVDYLLEIIALHKKSLLRDLSLEPGQLEDLLAELAVYKDNYAGGVFGYHLLLLEKGDSTEYGLRESGGGDSPRIRELFSRVFGHSMSEELHHWKYGDNRGRAVTAWKDDQLVGHYGGMGRDLLIEGQEGKGVQIGDVMVEPSERGRKGPFFLTASTFLERHIGYRSTYTLGFGFPNERVMRLAVILGLYEKVGEMAEVAWSPLERSGLINRYSLKAINRENSRNYAPAVEKLWRTMRSHLREAVVVKRTWQYLDYRYLSHPEKDYQLILVKKRFSPGYLGLLILYREEERCLLADLVCPLENIPLLIQQARIATREWGKTELYTWISKPNDNLFSGEGTVRPLDVAIPANVWSPGPQSAGIKDKWWLMAGDTDFM